MNTLLPCDRQEVGNEPLEDIEELEEVCQGCGDTDILTNELCSQCQLKESEVRRVMGQFDNLINNLQS